MTHKDNLMLFKLLSNESDLTHQKYSVALVDGKNIQLVTRNKKTSMPAHGSAYLLNDKDRILSIRWGTVEKSEYSQHGTCQLRIDNPPRMLFRFKHLFEIFELADLRRFINQEITNQLKLNHNLEFVTRSMNEKLLEYGLTVESMVVEGNLNV